MFTYVNMASPYSLSHSSFPYTYRRSARNGWFIGGASDSRHHPRLSNAYIQDWRIRARKSCNHDCYPIYTCPDETSPFGISLDKGEVWLTVVRLPGGDKVGIHVFHLRSCREYFMRWMLRRRTLILLVGRVRQVAL